MELQFGTQLLKEGGDNLQPRSISSIIHDIKTDAKLQEQVLALRRARAIDAKHYKKLKTYLPYVVGSRFHRQIRKLDQFESSNCWILDLDQCLSTPTANLTIFEKLKADQRVRAFYTSPSGDGLKVFFELTPHCTDATAFAAAYKNFALQFADQYALEGIVDLRTSDASRACFLSHDPHAYEAILATPVQWQDYLPPEKESVYVPTPAKVVLEEETILTIRQTLNPSLVRKSPKSDVIQSERLMQLQSELLEIAEAAGFQQISCQPIQYGLKFGASKEKSMAEVNVFHGKRGFSVVISPKSGTDLATSQALQTVFSDFLFDGFIPFNHATNQTE